MTTTEYDQESRTAISTQPGAARPMSAIDRLRTRRQVRVAYKLAERELAPYTTEADLQELHAMLERSEGRADVYTQIIERKTLSAA